MSKNTPLLRCGSCSHATPHKRFEPSGGGFWDGCEECACFNDPRYVPPVRDNSYGTQTDPLPGIRRSPRCAVFVANHLTGDSCGRPLPCPDHPADRVAEQTQVCPPTPHIDADGAIHANLAYAHLQSRLTAAMRDLAECYRLSGADPDGDEDWRLAPNAVAEVRRLRTELDDTETRLLTLESENKRLREALGDAVSYLRGVSSSFIGSKFEDHWTALSTTKKEGA